MKRLPKIGDKLWMWIENWKGVNVVVRALWNHPNSATTIGVIDEKGRAYEVKKEQLDKRF